MKPIILASASPRRKTILKSTGLSFQVIPSRYEEDNTLHLPVDELVVHLARGKAREVAKRYPEAVVIGVDTLVALGDKVIGKQSNAAEMVETLKALSGRQHSVFSGIAIVANDTVVTDAAETKVFFRKLTRREIEWYAAHPEEWQDKAGYGIQGLAALFVEKIEGDYLNILGLPLYQLVRRLRELDIDLLDRMR